METRRGLHLFGDAYSGEAWIPGERFVTGLTPSLRVTPPCHTAFIGIGAGWQMLSIHRGAGEATEGQPELDWSATNAAQY